MTAILEQLQGLVAAAEIPAGTLGVALILGLFGLMVVGLVLGQELAFVLGHEAAHHIAGHIPRRMQTAERGALLGAVYGSVTGADAATMAQLQRMGAEIGARRYSKEFELEADALGAQIAWRAGYDPVRGTGFFERLPDPGDQFLGSHPQNAQRSAQVAAVVAELERGAIR